MDANLLLKQGVGAMNALENDTAFVRKANIIRLNKNNPIFISMLRYSLGSPKTWLTKEKLDGHYFYIDEPDYITDWLTLMKYYEINQDDTEEDIVIAQLYLRNLDDDIKEPVRRILCHENKIRMDWITYNKAMEEK